MELVFWISAAWLVYVYAGYPLLLAIIGLFYRVRPQSREDYEPSVSVLIAARNEERDIGWKVAETLAWNYPAGRLEVLVASDASEDRTDEIVRSFDDRRVRLVRMERRGGKGRALNRLAEMARGDLLFFTDANSHIEPHCLGRMLRHFADARVGCVTGVTRPIREDSTQLIGRGASTFLSFEALINRLETRIGSVLVCDGAIFAIRRSLYEPLTPEIANDLELPMRAAHAGFWVLFEPEAIVGERDTSSVREEYRRRRRITAQGMLAMVRLKRQMLGGLRGFQFVSHKLLRYLTLLPLSLIVPATAGLGDFPLARLLLAGELAFYLAALTGVLLALFRRPAGALFSTPFYIVFGAVGALLGIVDACRGRRFDVWEIPTLSRGTLT